MTPSEILSERAAVCRVARTYIGTPYIHHGAIKGVGVDCATLLAMVYREAGVIDPENLGNYSPQWFMHHSEELYLAQVEKYAQPIDAPLPGDIAVFKFGHTFSHGVIVLDWPTIIHAVQDAGRVIEDRGDGGRLAGRDVKFYSKW